MAIGCQTSRFEKIQEDTDATLSKTLQNSSFNRIRRFLSVLIDGKIDAANDSHCQTVQMEKFNFEFAV